jgi:DHA2 family multidrug resistance protein
MALMIATAMQALDTTIANVALPQLEQSLGGGIELGSWVMTSYLCASAIMATLTGWLRRRYGARPLFIGSIGLFIIASGLCSIAPSSFALIQFRLVQGTAAGVIQPLAQAILLESIRSTITAEYSPSGAQPSWPARSSGLSSAVSSPTSARGGGFSF